MRKRLRKKKHLGEFREFGVQVKVGVKPDTDYDSFLDDWICQAVEGNGLSFGGGGSAPLLSGFVELGRHEQVAAKISGLEEWLKADPRVQLYEVGQPVDAWYGW
jgi:uncharacterized protein